ncbi:uncharacterized protein ARMOST_15458 [Armillaria ostoyae]|uniref:Uncharacterized protein n=1 Tax=Armillaria ostoyae TaxID=47428 RepID=A0A284RTC6_ARMOS|nr:uncharacterized protein ARMOST_15458 [Armillaria ostoyae]
MKSSTICIGTLTAEFMEELCLFGKLSFEEVLTGNAALTAVDNILLTCLPCGKFALPNSTSCTKLQSHWMLRNNSDTPASTTRQKSALAEEQPILTTPVYQFVCKSPSFSSLNAFGCHVVSRSQKFGSL